MLDAPVVRGDGCQHPAITDEEVQTYDQRVADSWGAAEAPYCPDCKNYLYPHLTDVGSEDGEWAFVLLDEPWGAGRDYWGRPNPSTHPEYWTE